VRRLGGRLPRRVDFRLLAATNTDLEAAVARRAFRADLFYRLNVIRIHLPPLRERKQDLPDLCRLLLTRLTGRPVGLSAEELARLASYPWPGNVRELANVLERAALLQQGGSLAPSLLLRLPDGAGTADVPAPAGEDVATLEDLERRHVGLALARSGGNLTQAARALGISLSTLKRKLKSERAVLARSG